MYTERGKKRKSIGEQSSSSTSTPCVSDEDDGEDEEYEEEMRLAKRFAGSY